MTNSSEIQHALACSIAELIVHESMTWEQAREQIRQELSYKERQLMPSSDDIETAVREIWSIFYPEKHIELLQQKRKVAIHILSLLSNFNAFLAGAVLNGCAGSETNIRIEVFCDDVKSVEIALMNEGISFEAINPESSAMPEPLESLGFLIRSPDGFNLEGVRIEIFSEHFAGINPYRKKPDQWQKPWESLGRISKNSLLSAISQ